MPDSKMKSLNREELYQLVWTEPMVSLAGKFGVSGSYLARVCTLMNVPRPERGYWAKLEAGKEGLRPSLPKAQPCDITEWKKGQPIPRQSRVYISSQKARIASGLSSDMHPFLNNIEPLYLKGRAKTHGYLCPYKRNLPDIVSSEKFLKEALRVANLLYQAFEIAGHTVRLAATTEDFRRHKLGEDVEWDFYPKLWQPGRITIACFGQVAVGLTLYEASEDTEVVHHGGDYKPLAKSGRRPRGAYVTTKKYPCGLLKLQAYSPYQGSDWSRLWDIDLTTNIEEQTQKIVKSLQRCTKQIKKMAQEAEAERIRKEEEWKRACAERTKQWARWEEEEKERKKQKSHTVSRDELLAVISKWGEAKRIEHFFKSVEAEILQLPDAQKRFLLERFTQAKELIGNTDALGYLLSWETPEEIFATRKNL